MSTALRLYYTNNDGDSKMLSLPPKDGLTQDEVKTGIEGIRDSGAFENCKNVVKGVLYTSETETLYEA